MIDPGSCDAVVIGGGVAGMSAAMELVSAGRRVVLLEARPRLGGRAYSFADPVSGDEIDNGQHLLLGCNTSALRFLRLAGVLCNGLPETPQPPGHGASGEAEHPVRAVFGGYDADDDAPLNRDPSASQRMQDLPLRASGRLNLLMRRDGVEAVLRSGRLFHPAGTAQAFLGYRFLSSAGKLAVFRLAAALALYSEDRVRRLDVITAAEWLSSMRQPSDAVEALWGPVCLATMNTAVQSASAFLFASILRKVFLSGGNASALLLPSNGLSALFARPVRARLCSMGAGVFERSRVVFIRPDSRKGEARCADGRVFTAPVFICALPPRALGKLLRASGLARDVADACPHFKPSPILSAQVWTRERITEAPMTGLLGSELQWIFDKGRSADGGWRYACTVSAADSFASLPAASRETRVREELRRQYPEMDPHSVYRVMTVNERYATHLQSPGLERRRATADSGLPNLILAGDWTATGLPATIESAAMSGSVAARLALARLG